MNITLIKNMKKILCLGISMIVLILITAESLFAKLTLIPSISLKEEYNDNLFLSGSDKKDDFITTITPHIVFEYVPFKSLDIKLNYGLDIRFYNRHSDLNDTSLSETQNITLETSFNPIQRVFINIFDTYKRVPIDPKRPFALDNAFFNMSDSNIFTVSPSIKLPLTSTVLTIIGYSYKNTWYKVEEGIDSDTHSAFWILDKRFSSKIKGTFRYNYLIYYPDIEDDNQEVVEYDKHEASVGIDYRITHNLEFNGEIGGARFDPKEYDKVSKATVWNIGVTYIFSFFIEEASIKANYRGLFNNSAISGAFKSRKAEIQLNTGKNFKLVIVSYHSIDKFLIADRTDKITGVTTEISWPIRKRTNILLSGLWEKQKFLPEEEKADRYSLKSSLDYKLTKSITVSAGYRYNRRDSNITEDFDNNIVWLQTKVTF